jgi:hypothetical protein
MDSHRKPLGTASRRTLLASAAGGAFSVATGLVVIRAQATTTTNPGFTRATNQPGPQSTIPTPLAATALVTRGLDFAWEKPRPSAVRAAGYTFACRYLSYSTTGKNLTRTEAQALAAAGVDIVSNWEYTASEALSGYSKGVTNAREAQRQALACGMPADRPIYFSVDFDATPGQQAAINAYFDGIASVLGRGRTGAYGGFYVIQRLFNAAKISWGWQTYAWSGGQWDSRAQLRQVRNGITVDGADCDLDEAWAPDFGQWGRASAPSGPALAVGRNADGRLQVFAERGGSLISSRQTALNAGFSAFSSFGGVQLSPNVVAANNADGRLQAFVVGGDGTVYSKWQNSPNGAFGDWFSLGAVALRSLAIGINTDRRMQMFAVGGDGVLYTSRQDSPNGAFTAWTSLAGARLSGTVIAATNPDGRLQAFVLGGDGLVYSKVQANPNGAFGGWISHGEPALRSLAIGSNSDGRLELFGTGTDGAAYTSFQTSVNGSFGRWYSLGGAQLSATVTAAQNADGRLQVFVLGGDGTVYSKVQASPNGVLGDWLNLGATQLRSLRVGTNADGRLQMFAIGSNGVAYTSGQTKPSGAFSAWASLG